MPIDDPTRELNEIISAYLDDQISEAAYTWARGALELAEEILQGAGERLRAGQAMTYEQEDALEEIYREAWEWLRSPSER